MTVSDQQMQAVNVINQHAQFLLRELEATDRDKSVLRREADMLRDRLKHAENTPTARDYQSVLRAKAELETKVKQQREFMALKDNAKIKVERDRDHYKWQASALPGLNRQVAELKSELSTQKSLNATQAASYKSLLEQYNNVLSSRSRAQDPMMGTAEAIKQSILTTEVNALHRKVEEQTKTNATLERERDEARREVGRLKMRLNDLKRAIQRTVDDGERWDQMGR